MRIKLYARKWIRIFHGNQEEKSYKTFWGKVRKLNIEKEVTEEIKEYFVNELKYSALFREPFNGLRILDKLIEFTKNEK